LSFRFEFWFRIPALTVVGLVPLLLNHRGCE